MLWVDDSHEILISFCISHFIFCCPPFGRAKPSACLHSSFSLFFFHVCRRRWVCKGEATPPDDNLLYSYTTHWWSGRCWVSAEVEPKSFARVTIEMDFCFSLPFVFLFPLTCPRVCLRDSYSGFLNSIPTTFVFLHRFYLLQLSLSIFFSALSAETRMANNKKKTLQERERGESSRFERNRVLMMGIFSVKFSHSPGSFDFYTSTCFSLLSNGEELTCPFYFLWGMDKVVSLVSERACLVVVILPTTWDFWRGGGRM